MIKDFINSPSWLSLVLSLVAIQAAIVFFTNGGLLFAICYITYAVFLLEVSLRFYTSRIMTGEVFAFFKSASNVIDFCVVLFDIVASILVLISSSNKLVLKIASGVTFGRYVRIVQLGNRIMRYLLSNPDQRDIDSANYPSEDTKRSEVISYRVPFENFAGDYENLHDSPIHLLNASAHKLRRLDVFDSPIALALIDFKWQRYGRRLFYSQFGFFVFFLVGVVTFGVLASGTASSDEDRVPVDGYYGAGVYSNLSYPTIASLLKTKGGLAAIVLFPAVTSVCVLSLLNEFRQFFDVGPSKYFQSIWNYVDIAGFSLELIAAVAWLLRSDKHAVRGHFKI